MQCLVCYWNCSDMEVSRHVKIFFLRFSEARTHSEVWPYRIDATARLQQFWPGMRPWDAMLLKSVQKHQGDPEYARVVTRSFVGHWSATVIGHHCSVCVKRMPSRTGDKCPSCGIIRAYGGDWNGDFSDPSKCVSIIYAYAPAKNKIADI